jgi:uncharacterized RDD family membrane protein YckC
MLFVMNATAEAPAAAFTGPKLDNRRVLAALVDLAIVIAGSVVILFAADALSGDNSEIRGALGAVILGWALYYHFAMESGDGQTVGKKVMKLRVVLADGRPAGMREIAVRTVLRVIDGIGAYIVGLIVMLATGQRRQRLGDLAAGTMVVDASATSYAPPAPESAAVEETVAEDEPSEIVEAPAVPEMRPFDPPTAEDEAVEDEVVEAEVVEDEVVEDEHVAAVEVVGSDEPVEDEVVEPVEDEVVEPVEDEHVAPVEVVGSDEPVEDEVVEDEHVEPVALEAVEDEYVSPVTLVQPVEDEPVAALTVVEDEVVEDEPVVPLTVVQVDEQVEDEEQLPEVSTPSLDELARDVDAARTDAEDDEPMTLKTVETVSAIDLVMGGAPEEDSSEQDEAPEGPAA